MAGSHKHTPVVYTPAAPHPAVTPELVRLFNAAAPATSLLPAKPPAAVAREHADKPSAVNPMLYAPHGSDIARLAEMRIRQWIVQQEEENRRASRNRLFGNPKS